MSILSTITGTILGKGRAGAMRPVVLILLHYFLCFPAFAEPPEQYFNQEREFPNLFVPEQYRGSHDIEIPPEILAKSRGDVQAALQSVFSRLTVPVVIPAAKETFFNSLRRFLSGGGTNPKTGEVRQVRFFDYLRKEIDPRVSIMPSGGIVRSGLSYLYSEMYRRSLENPAVPPHQVLAEIANDTRDIPAFNIRGVGSDFDVLVDGPRELLSSAAARIEKITNSALVQNGGDALWGTAVRGLFTIGDVKKYSEQIARSTHQGGATIDYLAFDVTNGAFVEPHDHSYVVEDFLRGRYRYIAPASETAEDGSKQTIRGLRALIELPFLRIADEAQIRKELLELETRVKNGEKLSEKTLEQINRMLRNAQFSGGANRFFRGQTGSLENLSGSLLGQIRKSRQHPGFPEFVDHIPIASRPQRLELIRNLLTPMSDFVRDHTNRGTLYHGTPTMDTAMAIFRGGLVVSGGTQSQGGYVYGTGGYSSPQLSTAQGYAGKEGIVLELEVNQGAPINILDLDVHGNDPIIQTIRERSAREGKDFHQTLSREYGIDIIVHGHVLIQNMAAIKQNKNPETILRALHSIFENPNMGIRARLNAAVDYRKMYPYGQALGIGNLAKPVVQHEAAEKILQSLPALFNSNNPMDRLNALSGIGNLAEHLPSVPESIWQLIADTKLKDLPSGVLDNALKRIAEKHPTLPDSVVPNIEKHLARIEEHSWDAFYKLALLIKHFEIPDHVVQKVFSKRFSFSLDHSRESVLTDVAKNRTLPKAAWEAMIGSLDFRSPDLFRHINLVQPIPDWVIQSLIQELSGDSDKVHYAAKTLESLKRPIQVPDSSFRALVSHLGNPSNAAAAALEDLNKFCTLPDYAITALTLKMIEGDRAALNAITEVAKTRALPDEAIATLLQRPDREDWRTWPSAGSAIVSILDRIGKVKEPTRSDLNQVEMVLHSGMEGLALRKAQFTIDGWNRILPEPIETMHRKNTDEITSSERIDCLNALKAMSSSK